MNESEVYGMSLKSFDKFCERMIMGEPVDRREVYDERQNQMRTKLIVEALWVYVGISGIAVLINDSVTCFASVLSLLAVCASVAFLWWTIRCAAKDCIFGIKGIGTVSGAWVLLIEAVAFILMYVVDNDEPFIDEKGLVGSRLMLGIGLFVLMISSLIVIVISIRRKKKTNESEDNS